jgi:hypothetical protein
LILTTQTLWRIRSAKARHAAAVTAPPVTAAQ